MTDRVPGAPGQYQALITAEALEKMRSGEAFPITLTRDDRPIVPGTPYSKAAVLPDALAQRLCPGNPDPTPADALAALLPATHGDDRNNPHGVTPAQIGAMANTSAEWLPRNGMSLDEFPSGITMYSLNPDLMIAEGVPEGFSPYATAITYKLSSYVCYEVTDVFGNKAVRDRMNNNWRILYTTGDKPTPAEIGAMPGGYSGVIYADPNGGTTSFNLPDVTEKRNYLGIIRGLNPAYCAVSLFCGYQNTLYWHVPIVTAQYIGVSANNGNAVTVTNNTGHNALYVRLIDMSIL